MHVAENHNSYSYGEEKTFDSIKDVFRGWFMPYAKEKFAERLEKLAANLPKTASDPIVAAWEKNVNFDLKK